MNLEMEKAAQEDFEPCQEKEERLSEVCDESRHHLGRSKILQGYSQHDLD